MTEVNLIEWQPQLAVCQVQWPTISIVDSLGEVNFDSFVCFVLDRLMHHSSCIPSVHRVNDQLWWRLIHSAGNFVSALTGFSLNYYPCRVCLVLFDYTILNRWFVDKPKGVWYLSRLFNPGLLFVYSVIRSWLLRFSAFWSFVEWFSLLLGQVPMLRLQMLLKVPTVS